MLLFFFSVVSNVLSFSTSKANFSAIDKKLVRSQELANARRRIEFKKAILLKLITTLAAQPSKDKRYNIKIC